MGRPPIKAAKTAPGLKRPANNRSTYPPSTCQSHSAGRHSECPRYAVPQLGIPSYLASGGQSDPQTAKIPVSTTKVLIIGAGSGGEVRTGNADNSAQHAVVPGYQRLFGRTGWGVTGIVVHRSNGSDVVAAGQDGWFLAWWPGEDERAGRAAQKNLGWPVTMRRSPRRWDRMSSR